jgi:phosphatidylinositol kinase/protein kinase (PI-3  family)
VLARDVDILASGLHRAAFSAVERVMQRVEQLAALEDAPRREELGVLVAQLDRSCCENDRWFATTFGPSLRRVAEMTRGQLEAMKRLFLDLEDTVLRVEVLQLAEFSTHLAERRGFAIAVPGEYSLTSHQPLLRMVETTLPVLGSQQRPRIVYMHDMNGERHKFLLKGGDDLRVDQRTMQSIGVINSGFGRNRSTRGLRIDTFPIIPFSPDTGLITWVAGTETMSEMIGEVRQIRGATREQEMDFAVEASYGKVNLLSAMQRLEVFEQVGAKFPAFDLAECSWAHAPDATTWLNRTRAFTLSAAATSMVGWVLGLGDRHPSNILIHQETGRVIHIDFSDVWERARTRASMPERVPFRLTRMIERALDCGDASALFSRGAEDVLWVLRDLAGALLAQLEGQEGGPSDVSRKVARKLAGVEGENIEELGRPATLHEHVADLVNAARDPQNYTRHFVGWCPFW